MEVIKISKSQVDKIPYPEKGQIFFRDSDLTGFGIYVGRKTKTYYAEKRVNGKTVRTVIGRHGQITAEEARRKGSILLGQMTAGKNPLDEKRAKQARGVTLKEAYDDFKRARKALKPKTLYDYDRIMEVAFRDWQRKRIADVTKDMVSQRHKKLGESNGEAYANLSLRFLRSLFNFCIGEYQDSQGCSLILENPVKRLSQTRAWYRVERRQRVLKTHELPDWFKAVIELQNDVLRDYLFLLIFSGLRRKEAAELQWKDIDFKAQTLTILTTKNNEPLTLPLSDYLLDLLSERKKTAVNDFVFPGTGKSGHIIEPRAAIKQVTESSGIKFSLHDLRRTFITVAESLDIPGYALKRLVNHKMSGDITAGYIVTDVERLRRPMQKITDFMLKLSGVKPDGKVIELGTTRTAI